MCGSGQWLRSIAPDPVWAPQVMERRLVGSAQANGGAAAQSPTPPDAADAAEPAADASSREAASMEPQQRGEETPAAEDSGVVVRALRQRARQGPGGCCQASIA